MSHRIVHITTVHQLRDPRIFLKECPTLHAAGYEVHLVAQHDKAEVLNGIHVHALPRITSRLGRLKLQRKAFEVASSLAADLYHIHDPELIPVLYALKQKTGARVIYDMHEDYWYREGAEGMLLRALERWCFSWVDHVVTVNDYLAGRLHRLGVPVTLVANYYLPHGEEREKTKAWSTPVELLYTGVIAEERGLTDLLEICVALERTGLDARLSLVGVCFLEAERARAEALLKQRGGETVLRRVGWDSYVPMEVMYPYYATAHVGLALLRSNPGHEMTLPTKFFEYLNNGLPVLCSNLPKWQRFIEEYECGVTVTPGDTPAVLRQLRDWQADPKAYARLAANALSVAQIFRWEPMGERLVQTYRTVLASAA